MTTDDPIECYQAIGSALANTATKPWDRIVMEADLDGQQEDVTVACWCDDEDAPNDYLAGVPRLASHVYEFAWLVSTLEKGFSRSSNSRLSPVVSIEPT